MFSIARQSFARRAFSTTAARNDMAKVTLIGRIGKAPEIRTNKNGKEYVSYAVCTNSNQPDGSSRPTWHNILSFKEASRDYLASIPKGSLVYVESNLEIREPVPEAPQTSPQSQRSIFYRHEFLRVLRKGHEGESEEFVEAEGV